MTDPTCQRCGKSLWLHAEMDYTGETDIAVCEGDMKTKIKTPVRYEDLAIIDADGEAIAEIWTKLGETDAIPDAKGKQIADALNATAREARLAEALTLAVQCFNDLERDIKTHNPKYRSWPMADEAIASAVRLLAEHRGEQ